MREVRADSLLDELCRLARLRLDDSNRKVLGQRLDAVVLSFAALRSVGTGSKEEAPATAACRLRADEAESPLSLDAALANCKRAAAGCFLVPRVVEG